MSVKVRFAPSPTGHFSLGNARTALFNWLFAKHENGEFFVRVEDTDKERSKKEYEDELLHGLEWLGLKWDNEITRQSERIKIYENYLSKMLQEKTAYWCFCKPEELELERQAQLSQGLPPKYSGRCRSLGEETVKKRLETESAVIRFKMPEREIHFNDLVRGKVEFNTRLIGDIIIAKSLREPLYNFAATIDDFEMEISHVIRGEDHLSNTPKQIAIQDALNFPHPHYAHLPLILGPDRKKLSKRYLETSLFDFIKEGYLPEAILNFLVLLGWHPEEDKEILNIQEMINKFDLKRVQKSGAIFNAEKLEYFNSYYIKIAPKEDLFERLKSFIPGFWLNQEDLIKRIIEVEKFRIKKLSEFTETASFFFMPADYEKGLLIWKEAPEEKIRENLKTANEIIKSIPEEEFNKNKIEKDLMKLAEECGRGEVLWPIRVALSGKDASPGPIDLAQILGKTETIKRIENAISKLEK